MFDNSLPLTLLSIAFSIILLIKSADLIEESFVYISKRLRLSEFFLGFFVLGIVSSLPELAIAVYSSDEVPELSVGNLLGATLVLLTLVLGMGAIKFGGVNFKGRFRRREMFGGMFTILLAIFFLLDAELEVYEGVILIITYLLLLLDVRNQFNHKKEEELAPMVSAEKVYKLLLKSLLGILILLVASNIAVESVIDMGKMLNISNSLIGLFVLALGTNVPELTLMLRSKNHDQYKLSIGNFIGSAIFNSVALGVLAILSGGFLIRGFVDLVPVMVIIAQAAVLFLYFAWTDREINKTEGFILLGGYFSLIITEAILLFYK